MAGFFLPPVLIPAGHVWDLLIGKRIRHLPLHSSELRVSVRYFSGSNLLLSQLSLFLLVPTSLSLALASSHFLSVPCSMCFSLNASPTLQAWLSALLLPCAALHTMEWYLGRDQEKSLPLLSFHLLKVSVSIIMWSDLFLPARPVFSQIITHNTLANSRIDLILRVRLQCYYYIQ